MRLLFYDKLVFVMLILAFSFATAAEAQTVTAPSPSINVQSGNGTTQTQVTLPGVPGIGGAKPPSPEAQPSSGTQSTQGTQPGQTTAPGAKPEQGTQPAQPPSTAQKVDDLALPGTTVIKADHILYDQDQVIATGHVSLIYDQRTTVQCETMKYNTETGWVESDDDILLFAEGEKMIGHHFRYNVDTQQGSLDTVQGQTKNIYANGAPIRGTLFYNAKGIEIDHNVLLFKGVDSSTCDYPWGTKHYHIAAEEIKVIPGDKMVISHGRLWLGKIPLYHVSKMVIDLHPQVYHRQSYMPQFGYDQIDGFFMKNTLNYLAGRNMYGNLLVDLYQKTGVGLGIEHQYTIGKRGSGHLSLYNQVSTGAQAFTRQQIVTNDNYNFGNGLTFNGNFNLFRFRVPPIVSPDTIGTQAALNKQAPNYSWNLTETSNATSGFSNTQNVQYHQSQNFGNNLSMSLDESFYKSMAGNVQNQSFHNLTSFSKQFNTFTASLGFEKTDTSVGGSGFINRTPEVNLTSNSLKFQPWNLDIPYQVSMAYGSYFQSFNGLQATRWDFQVNVPQYDVELGHGLKYTSSSLYRQDFYNTNGFYPTQIWQARYILGNESQLSEALSDHVAAVMDYRSQSHIGFDPLVYDAVAPFRTLAGEVAFYNKDYWRLDIGTAYDYKNHFYQQLVTRVDLKPVNGWELHFDGMYDPNLHQWQNLISQADLWVIKDDVRIQYWSSYSLINGQVGYQDIALYKEWHDWEGRLIYRWENQQVMLLFNLKAFPEQQVQLGINPLLNLDPASAQFEVH